MRQTALPRHLPDCVGETHDAGGGGVCFCVPGVWWRHPDLSRALPIRGRSGSSWHISALPRVLIHDRQHADHSTIRRLVHYEVVAPDVVPVHRPQPHARPLGHCLPLSQPSFSFSELPNDLLRRELLPSWHLLPSLGLRNKRFSLYEWRRLRGAGHDRPPATGGQRGF
jgi:hypothetical protein